MLNRVLSILFFLVCLQAYSQPADVDTSDYVFPINPGQRNYLAGTMGELRGGHFHGGIDVRTGGQIGLPVYATHDGYISRIKVSSGGYGHALYLQHTDGYSSLYGHLDRFNEELELYIRKEQYQLENYEVQVFPDKEAFSYKKGDIIGYSGNSGSSSGPHLHFEIRDKDQNFIDPLFFGFDEVVDRMIPVAKKVAFVTLDEKARINNGFGRFEFDLIYSGNSYVTRKPIALDGLIGIELYHYDYMDGSWARNGIPEVTATVNGDTIFSQSKDAMSFNLNKHINVHTNYQASRHGSKRFNKLYLDDGNQLNIYKKTSKGTVFEADKEYDIALFLKDRNSNIATLKIKANNRKVVYSEFPRFNKMRITGNYLQIVDRDSTLCVYSGNQVQKLLPIASKKDKYHYIWDLRKSMPDSITGKNTHLTDLQVMIPSNRRIEFFNTDYNILVGKNDLFDTLYLQHKKEIDSTSNLEIFDFGPGDFPLKRAVTITLKPEKKYTKDARVFTVYRKKLHYVGGDRNADGTFEFNTNALETYTISYDTVPPAFVPYSWSSSNLRIKVFDEHSGIKKYRATLNGEFLLMAYDRKKDMLIARPKIPNTPIKGEFKLVIEDFTGNRNEISRKL